MALDGTYAGLKASVADWLNRADLTAVVPDFITLAEGQMNRRLRVRRMVVAATAQISAEYETLPGDFAGALALTLTDGRQLDFLTPDALAQKKFLHQPWAGEPTHYSVVGTQLQFYPYPDQTYTALLFSDAAAAGVERDQLAAGLRARRLSLRRAHPGLAVPEGRHPHPRLG
jgi:hypothetical protein